MPSLALLPLRLAPACARAVAVLLCVAMTSQLLAAKSNPKKGDEGGWRAFLPNALRKNPRLICTAMTEFTVEGRKWRVVTPASPATFVTHSRGAQFKGGTSDETMLAQEEVEPLVLAALKRNGFHRQSDGGSADLVVVYFWGVHNNYTGGFVVSDDALVRSVLDRAALVGGKKFAARLARAYRDTEDLLWSSPPELSGPVDAYGRAPIGIASSMAQFNAVMSPLRLFAQEHQELFDQVRDDCYFVVASAYDYQALAKNEAVLLWRTRLTVSARGVSPSESMPAMIEGSADFFGREMSEPKVFKRNAVKSGTVDVGTPETVSDARKP